MITTISAAFPSPAQGVWFVNLFGLEIPIRAYALCIIVGIVAALLIGDRRWAARGGERGVIYDIALWAVPFGLIGGRLYHVLTDWQTYFGPGGAGPAAALRIWDGGLGIWGAVALGGVGAWIGCRRRGIPLPAFGDAIAPGIVLAQAIGRVGNYFNQELYGRETDVPWGLEIFYRRDPSGIVDVHSLNGVSTGEVAAIVHPTFLYELLWNLLVFVLLILIDRRWKVGHGRLFASYVALYCVGRFVVELLRSDTATHLAGIRINSFTSVFVFLGAVVYIILAPKGREDPSLLRGNIDSDREAFAQELAEELVAVTGTSGVVAAATVAGAEDSEYTEDRHESTGEAVEPGLVEPDLAESDGAESGAVESDADDVDADADDVDADDVDGDDADGDDAETQDPAADASEAVEIDAEVDDAEEQDVEADTEDEATLEAEVEGPGIETENAAEAEVGLIDEDHDPVDDENFEDFLGDETGDAAALKDDAARKGDAARKDEVPAPEEIDDAIDEAVAVEQVTDADVSDHDADEPDVSMVSDSPSEVAAVGEAEDGDAGGPVADVAIEEPVHFDAEGVADDAETAEDDAEAVEADAVVDDAVVEDADDAETAEDDAVVEADAVVDDDVVEADAVVDDAVVEDADDAETTEDDAVVDEAEAVDADVADGVVVDHDADSAEELVDIPSEADSSSDEVPTIARGASAHVENQTGTSGGVRRSRFGRIFRRRG